MKKWGVYFSSYMAGLVFALGLGLAGMTQPQKIIAILDLTGDWDPSLMFVMGGALAVHLVTYRLITKRKNPLFDSSFHIPDRSEINIRLVGGSALFGVGWGLSGFCPGPAIVSLVNLQTSTLVFVLSMVIGMFVGSRQD